MTSPAPYKGSLTSIMEDHRDRLARFEYDASRDMTRAYSGIIDRLSGDIRTLTNKIAARQAEGKSVPVSWLHKQEAYRTLILKSYKEHDNFRYVTKEQLASAQELAIREAMKSSTAMMEYKLPGYQELVGSFHSLPTKAIQSIRGALDVGSPLTTLLNRFGDQAREAIDDALTQGLALGEHPDQVLKRITDKLEQAPTRAKTLVRTEMYRAFREGNRATFKENAHIVERWTWFAHLGGQTCAACLAMHGQQFPLDEPMGSHPNCRCTMLPETKSWADLGFPPELDDQRVTGNDVGSGEDFLKKAPDKVAREAFGNNKLYDEWKHGNIKLEDVVRTVDHPEWGRTRTINGTAAALKNATARKAAEALEAAKPKRVPAPKKVKPTKEASAIDQARALIAKGYRTEDDVRAAGRLIRQGIDQERVKLQAAVDKITAERELLRNRYLKIADEIDEIDQIPLGLRTLETRAKKAKLLDEFDEIAKLQKPLNAKLATAVDKLSRNKHETTIAALKKVRPGFGTGKLTNGYAWPSTDTAKKLVDRTQKALPKEWIDSMNASGKRIRTQIVDRGVQRDLGDVVEVMISGYDDASRYSTALHEMTHFAETVRPNVAELERQFYERRTAGYGPERLADLFPGHGYRDDEITTVDKFEHPYMGKRYGNRYFEVATMGVEDAVGPGGPYSAVKLEKDEDLQDFILGLLGGA
jgi:SPP1 gp7 family putative phage head morphogenesis protein